MSAELKHVDWFQLRAPTYIATYLIPWFGLFSRKTGWIKYAGNWGEPNPPLSYRLQRFMISRIFKNRIVTINGKWPGQPKHCVSFENPCLTDEEIKSGRTACSKKDFSGTLNLLFVGRIEEPKESGRILKMITCLDPKTLLNLESLTLIGEGAWENYAELAASLNIKLIHLDGLPREELNAYYSKSHILLLPSDSEGFPKVVAEAAAFGCIPVVSNISSLGQYINPENGLIFTSLEPTVMAEDFSKMLIDRKKLKTKALGGIELARKFTYDYYNRMIIEKIINPHSH